MTAAGGRPSSYRPEFCDIVVELGKQGKSKTAIACELGVVKQTLYSWMSSHPEFLDAMMRAEQFSQLWWEDRAQKGIDKPTSEFNAGLWGKVMSARFPAEYREQKAVELTGANGGPIKSETTVHLTPDEAYKRMLDG